MSTINATNIKNAASSVTNIILDTNGGVTAGEIAVDGITSTVGNPKLHSTDAVNSFNLGLDAATYTDGVVRIVSSSNRNASGNPLNWNPLITGWSSGDITVDPVKVFDVQKDGSITAAGSGTFAGDVTSNLRYQVVHPSAASSSIQVWGAYAAGVNTSSIASDGSANFAGGKVAWDENGSASFSGPVKIGGITANNQMSSYDQGTWVPGFRGSGTAGDYDLSNAQGEYVKIGRMITVWGRFTISAVNSAGTNTPWITGTPYGIGDVVGSNGVTGILTTTAGSANMCYLAQGGGRNGFYVRQQQDDGDSPYSIANFAAGESFYFYATYPSSEE